MGILVRLFISNFHDKVLIPEKVYLEIRREDEESPLIEKLIKDKKMVISKVKDRGQVSKLMKDFSIDDGEAEAISLAFQENIPIVATDDRNAIRACKMLKIDFVTTIAILLRAFEKKLIDEEKAVIKLQKLQSIGRYSKAIIDDAEKRLRGGV